MNIDDEVEIAGDNRFMRYDELTILENRKTKEM